MKIPYPIKNNLFTISIIIITALVLAFIFYLSRSTNFVNPGNVSILSYIFKISFLVASVSITLVELYKKHNQNEALFSLKNLLIVSLIGSLVLTIFYRRVGIYGSGVFVGCTLLYFIIKRKLFSLNKVYFFIFGFAFFRFMGTIGSNKGFYFPDYTLSFYVIPLSYCFFNFSKETFITIMKVLFRIIFVYITISLCYWFFNISYIKIPIYEWITSKIGVGITPAFDYIGKWSGYSHPSYISLVLFSTLIIGFYLLYKSVITKFELIIFIASNISLELILESRIGLVGVLFIVTVSILYYAKLKTQIFTRILLFIFILGVAGTFLGYNKLDSFVTDVNRKTDYTLAINYIKDNLWWGAGTMGQEKALIFQEQKMLDVLPSAHNKKTYVHNTFLGEMVQYGLWGLLVMAILLGALAVSAYKSRNYLYQVFLMVFILFMLIEEPLYVQEGITYFMVYLTFFIGVADTSKTRKSIHLNLKKEKQ